jgi:hypothetical protein
MQNASENAGFQAFFGDQNIRRRAVQCPLPTVTTGCRTSLSSASLCEHFAVLCTW